MPPLPDRPAVLVVGAAGQVVATSPEAPAWLAAVGRTADEVVHEVLRRRRGREPVEVLLDRPCGRRVAAHGLPLGDRLGIVLSLPTLAAALRARAADLGLTPREVDVLRLLLRGHADRAIAETLIIAPETAREYTGRVLRKAGVRRRTELAPRLLVDYLEDEPAASAS